jgi:F0F1-type ATP synthase membrane subunit b/b'
MTADELLQQAEEEIEAWLCELDSQWTAILDDARAEADRIVTDAQARAEADAELIISEAQARAEDEYERLRALAAEHAEAVKALAAAEDVELADEHLESLHEAVVRLRAELSRVVDAAFDAIPAVEATADAIERARGGRLRRLFRRR